jgi:hypothetical protein
VCRVSRRYLEFRADRLGGLSNVRMGLDIGVGLAQLTRRTLVLYDVTPLWRGSNPVVAEDGDRGAEATILDLFEVPVPSLPEAQYGQVAADPGVRDLGWPDLYNCVFRHPAMCHADERQFADFRNRRPTVVTLSQEDDEASVLRFSSRGLSLYSYFFYLPEDLRAELIRTMARVQPRTPFRQLSDDLCASFGNFNAVHIRRGDFMRGYYKGTAMTPQTIVANLLRILPPTEQLLICTDESSDSDFFGPILTTYRQGILLDQYLLHDPVWRERLRSLPCNADLAIAVISQIVAGRAGIFAGSLFSTFSAMIHRDRGLRTGDDPFLFVFNPYDGVLPFRDGVFLESAAGAFTWNRFPLTFSSDVYAWFREWPEAFR